MPSENDKIIVDSKPIITLLENIVKTPEVYDKIYARYISEYAFDSEYELTIALNKISIQLIINYTISTRNGKIKHIDSYSLKAYDNSREKEVHRDNIAKEDLETIRLLVGKLSFIAEDRMKAYRLAQEQKRITENASYISRVISGELKQFKGEQ